MRGERSGPADDAVVHVFAASSCTGVLVDRSLVMTALHCVARDLQSASSSCSDGGRPLGATFGPEGVRVSVGSNIDALEPYAVREIVVGPSRQMCDGDMALLVLERPVAGVTPRAVRTEPPTVGSTVTAVGWGVNDYGQYSSQRMRRSGILVLGAGGGTVTRAKPDGGVSLVTCGSKEIVTDEGICQGDSGGPLFDAAGAVAAIVSRVQRGCVGSLSIHSDVSYWRDLSDEARARQ